MTNFPNTRYPHFSINEELYHFGADGNLRLYSYDRLFFALYGYDGGTTRTYKYSMDLSPNWVNGRLESVNFNLHNAMFYPNSYLNFNKDGYYTKHYYNGMERIASRLGDQHLPIHTHDPELQDRKDQLDSNIRRNIADITGYEFLPVGEEQTIDDPKPIFELPVIGISNLQPSADGIYYYHSNHLGSTCYVTDENAIVQQGFLYAPFGEITNEHSPLWQNGNIPKYAFNAKELDEETGMYYYEARYYAPPVFISRDPHFERYPTFSPYIYCYNNPVKYVDPTGKDGEISIDDENKTISVRANFYYNSSQLEQSEYYNIKKGFQDALDFWSSDIKTALATMGFDEYTVNILFEWKEVDIGDATGEDAIKIIQSAANSDPIGNSIVHDENILPSASVSNNKHLSANMEKAGFDNGVFFGTDGGNTAMHEIGHLLGLRDRYNPKNPEHAPYIEGDLMSVDYPRSNAVAPFIRIMNYINLMPGSSKSVLINKNNKEPK